MRPTLHLQPKLQSGQLVCWLGLAPDGVCHAQNVAVLAVRSYRTFSPLPKTEVFGGIFSAALSICQMAFLTFVKRPALWSSEVPPRY
jgi:hypothetical protein